MKLTNRKYFGWFTILLSAPYLLISVNYIRLLLMSEEFNKYGINALAVPLTAILLIFGGLRIYNGVLLLKERFDLNWFKIVFGFICFIEIFVGLFYGLIISTKLPHIGQAIISLYLIYYINAYFFLKFQEKK